MYENKNFVNFDCEPMGEEPWKEPQHIPTEPPKKKKHHGGKIVALALSCALLGGAGGGTAVYFVMDRFQPTQVATSEKPIMETPKVEQMSSVTTQPENGEMLTPQEVYAQNVNSVVGITTSSTTTNYFGQISEYASTGSGFIITDDGYIVTNNHVVEGGTKVQVALYDGATYDATVIGTDANNDVALLKVEATGLQAVSLGNSETMRVGDQVAAIGNPLGELTFTQTVGYISAVDRAINTDGTPVNMIQTDVAINSGNSGGPLFDMYGNVVGVTTAKYSGDSGSGASIEGIGFALPINDVSKIVNDLKEYGYVTGKAYLGVVGQALDAQTATYYGLPQGFRIASVDEGSCAETAGMMEGDIITQLNDQETKDYSALATQLSKLSPGDTTTIQIYRAGETLTLTITLDEKTSA